MKVHVWVPDYVSSMGGIQTLSRFLVRAVSECLPNAQMLVLAKNDVTVPDAPEGVIAKFSSVGWWSSSERTVAFALALSRHAMERPDLIIMTHANFAPVAHFFKKLFGIPFIVLGNGVEVWEIPSKRLRSALRSADALLAISQYTQERMAKALNISQSSILRFPCTFDSEKFQLASKPHFLLKHYRIHADQPVILTVARLDASEQYKGYDQILRALPAVKRVFPNVRYIVGGRGPDRPRVTTLIRELNLNDTVILVGYIPDHDLCAFYNLCDVFAMPSKGEGFGIVFLEALACGKPVIAGNKDGSVDAVLSGKLGVLVDPDNVDEVADALIQVLAKKYPLKILQRPEELRREVIDAYGYSKFVKRVQDVLEPFLAKGKKRNRKIETDRKPKAQG